MGILLFCRLHPLEETQGPRTYHASLCLTSLWTRPSSSLEPSLQQGTHDSQRQAGDTRGAPHHLLHMSGSGRRDFSLISAALGECTRACYFIIPLRM